MLMTCIVNSGALRIGFTKSSFNFQDPSNKQFVICDEELSKVFGNTSLFLFHDDRSSFLCMPSSIATFIHHTVHLNSVYCMVSKPP